MSPAVRARLNAITASTSQALFAVNTPEGRCRTLITIPARVARSARRITLHLPEAWPWQAAFDRLFTVTRYYMTPERG
jgi:hypothetical protein